jgi:restriction system protein
VSFTPASGDQGVDLLAEGGGQKLAIQCKDYQVPVGNDAVQQGLSGGAFYRAQRCIVVVPKGFTSSALQLAKSLGVVCTGRPSSFSR